ncbi:hypothetical protein CBW46_019265 [Paenibacillus xerothermodurans]|uniref:Uncharacterized protein n=1 Tax=Paenibacillus xerothermodurans TaxID=1977292 RepID=A0A2W1NWX2_PAEXE|nr:hypothetical protein CBW46_019265 [Paenibacillus xerothermodurans]
MGGGGDWVTAVDVFAVAGLFYLMLLAMPGGLTLVEICILVSGLVSLVAARVIQILVVRKRRRNNKTGLTKKQDVH